MRILRLLLPLILLIGLTGCSVVMASKQPKKKDLTVLNVGTHRMLVIAEFGTPIFSETRDGAKVDIFKFVQGYSTGAKTARAVGHGVADVFTLGLWEVIGTPTEAIFDGQENTVQVTYDESDKIRESVIIKQKS